MRRSAVPMPAAVGRRPFQLQPKDHIGIIGNTLAERMQYDGWLETMLHARFPRHELVIRNLGFSGDEVATRLRSKNFGTPDEWLSGTARRRSAATRTTASTGANTKADVIFAFFGYNESYAGQEGLAAFKKELGDWIDPYARAEVQRQVGPARRALFADRAREPGQSGSARTASRTTGGWSSIPKAMADVAQGRRRHVRRPVHAQPAAVRLERRRR